MILFILGFVVAVVAVVIVLWAAGKGRGMDSRLRGNDKAINPEQVEKRRENLKKVMEMAREKGEIRNDDVQHALKVSDATATRYLEELERRGKLVQTGAAKGTIYRAKYGSTGG